MEKIFDTIIDSFIENKVGIAQDFLGSALSSHLQDNLAHLHRDHLMDAAGTGNEKLATIDQLVRSDVIYWLDRKHQNIYEDEFFDLIDSFVVYLNRTCYTGITGYEFHYTLYEKGSFYTKHIDQFQQNGNRAYSMVMYLNENWVAKDGGELCIHHDDKVQYITPINGKSVFFKSDELAHEVLVAHAPRMSITGWLKV